MLNLPTTEERLGKSPQRLVRYFVLLMSLVYLGLGIWLLYTANKPVNEGLEQLPPTARRILGGVLVLYGLIRFLRAAQEYFRQKNSSTDE